MNVVLIPCAPSEWQQSGRILGRTELPVLEGSPPIDAATIEAARRAGVTRIVHAPDELSTAAAAALAKALKLKAKSSGDLTEVDVGLWVGLTDEQLSSRYSSAYHELRESPLNVAPPEGEDFGSAMDRLVGCLNKLARRTPDAVFGVVLRPIAAALLRHQTGGLEASDIWQAALDAPQATSVVLGSSGPNGAEKG